MNDAAGPVSAVFILSSWHSGSTWIGYVLGSTWESAFLGEYYRLWSEQDRVPCTLCAARGLLACEVLDGIDAHPVDQAFAIASARNKKRVLVDSSKRLDWVEQFTGLIDLDRRFIHVVRDPRGWFASAQRRGESNLKDAVNAWCEENVNFQKVISGSGGAGLTVSYDLLARTPRRNFRRLFAFCGMEFDDRALHYWNAEHHGFAANGASDAVISSTSLPFRPRHFVTGDDEFYKKNSKRFFHDERWRAVLSSEEERAIRENPEVKALLRSLGYRLTRYSIERIWGWPVFGWFR